MVPIDDCMNLSLGEVTHKGTGEGACEEACEEVIDYERKLKRKKTYIS